MNACREKVTPYWRYDQPATSRSRLGKVCHQKRASRSTWPRIWTGEDREREELKWAVVFRLHSTGTPSLLEPVYFTSRRRDDKLKQINKTAFFIFVSMRNCIPHCRDAVPPALFEGCLARPGPTTFGVDKYQWWWPSSSLSRRYCHIRAKINWLYKLPGKLCVTMALAGKRLNPIKPTKKSNYPNATDDIQSFNF